MATVYDAASYVLRQQGRMTTMKLQKLVYYSQGWSLAWGSGALFGEPIEAWAEGPVVRTLWEMRRGFRMVDVPDLPPVDADALTPEQRSDMDAVLGAYGGLSAEQLSAMTHRETPWLVARQTGHLVMAHDALTAYFGSLDPFGIAVPVEGPFLTKTLLSRCLSGDPHGEVDWGRPVGQEVW